MEENNSTSDLKIVKEYEAGGILFKIEGEKISFLIIHRDKQDDWSFPKGHLEGEETPEDCVHREVAEETGWCGEIISKVGIMNYTHHHKEKNIMRDVSVDFFLIKPTKEDKSLHIEGGHSYKWIEYGDGLLNVLTYPVQKLLLEKAYDYLKSNGDILRNS
jgi:8-oxo-dGTP pyrophosphatase MutT (NUDIX family)